MKTTKKPVKNLSLVSLKLVKEKDLEYDVSITFDVMAAQILAPFFEGLDREAFYVLSLNNMKKPLSINLVSLGSLTTSIVEAREVFKPAILSNAHGIIVAHNHPSGEKEASEADIRVTEKLEELGMMMGIQLLDHLIFYGEGKRDFTSFKAKGYL